MNNNQLEVLKWCNTGCEHTTGVSLFFKFGKNKVLQNVFLRKNPKYVAAKLKYELCKSVGLDWKNLPPLPDSVKTEIGSQPSGFFPSQNKQIPIVTNTPLSQYPKIIRSIKYERSKLYNNRSILHREMSGIPVNNTTANVKDRAIKLEEINSLSRRLDFLYEFIKQYEQIGTIPEETDVWPKQILPKPPTIAELKKEKKNLQTANTRDRNMLKYQQATKAKKLKPMPNGPKRNKIEKRMSDRNTEIDKINTKIKEIPETDAAENK